MAADAPEEMAKDTLLIADNGTCNLIQGGTTSYNSSVACGSSL